MCIEEVCANTDLCMCTYQDEVILSICGDIIVDDLGRFCR